MSFEPRRTRILHVKSAALGAVCAGFLGCALLIFLASEPEARGAAPGRSAAHRTLDALGQANESEADSATALAAQVAALRTASTPQGNRARVRAIRALGALKDERAQAKLRELAFESKNTLERLAALNVLWAAGQQELLISRAQESNDPLLSAKVKALQEARDP